MFNIILLPVLIFAKEVLNKNDLLNSLVALAIVQLIIPMLMNFFISLIPLKSLKSEECLEAVKNFILIILYVFYIFFGYKYFNFSDMTSLIIISYLTSYLLVDFVRNLIIKLKAWIFSDCPKDELVKNKLSFINKIIVGFLSVVATIISILISLKKLH